MFAGQEESRRLEQIAAAAEAKRDEKKRAPLEEKKRAPLEEVGRERAKKMAEGAREGGRFVKEKAKAGAEYIEGDWTDTKDHARRGWETLKGGVSKGARFLKEKLVKGMFATLGGAEVGSKFMAKDAAKTWEHTKAGANKVYEWNDKFLTATGKAGTKALEGTAVFLDYTIGGKGIDIIQDALVAGGKKSAEYMSKDWAKTKEHAVMTGTKVAEAAKKDWKATKEDLGAKKAKTVEFLVRDAQETVADYRKAKDAIMGKGREAYAALTGRANKTMDTFNAWRNKERLAMASELGKRDAEIARLTRLVEEQGETLKALEKMLKGRMEQPEEERETSPEHVTQIVEAKQVKPAMAKKIAYFKSMYETPGRMEAFKKAKDELHDFILAVKPSETQRERYPNWSKSDLIDLMTEVKKLERETRTTRAA